MLTINRKMTPQFLLKVLSVPGVWYASNPHESAQFVPSSNANPLGVVYYAAGTGGNAKQWCLYVFCEQNADEQDFALIQEHPGLYTFDAATSRAHYVQRAIELEYQKHLADSTDAAQAIARLGDPAQPGDEHDPHSEQRSMVSNEGARARAWYTQGHPIAASASHPGYCLQCDCPMSRYGFCPGCGYTPKPPRQGTDFSKPAKRSPKWGTVHSLYKELWRTARLYAHAQDALFSSTRARLDKATEQIYTTATTKYSDDAFKMRCDLHMYADITVSAMHFHPGYYEAIPNERGLVARLARLRSRGIYLRNFSYQEYRATRRERLAKARQY